MPDDKRPRPRTQRAQDILDAGRRLVSEQGAAATHVAQIAHTAGVSLGLLSYHYETKEALLAAILAEDADAGDALLVRDLGNAESLDELVAALERTLRAIWFLPTRMNVASASAALAAAQAQTSVRYRNRLAELLAHHAHNATIVLRDDPLVVATVLLSLGRGLADERLASPHADSDATRAYALTLIRRGLAPD
jgi:AcrR family transcriptional regulator